MVTVQIYEFLLVIIFNIQSLLKSCTVKMILSIVQVRKLNLKG